MSARHKRRGIESVSAQSSTGSMEQMDDTSAPMGASQVCDIERESASPDASSIEAITDDPLTEKRNEEP